MIADGDRFPLGESLDAVSEELTARFERLQKSEHSYRQLFELHPLPLLIVDPATLAIREANNAASDRYGWSAEDQFTLAYGDLVADGVDPELPREAGSIVAARHRTRDEQIIDVELFGQPVDMAGDDSLLLCALDVTAERASEAAGARSVSLLRATLEATGDGVIVADLDGRISSCNQRFLELWDLAEGDVLNADARDVVSMLGSQLADDVDLSDYIRTLFEDSVVEESGLINLIDGRVFERSSRPQRLGSEIVGRVWCVRDVTERIGLEKELAHQAYHDALTGLANRAHFTQRMAMALRAAGNQPEKVGVIVLDLDGFKAINDTFGHGGGDDLLSHVARRLLNATRGCDTVARIGGDEFAVLLENVKNDQDLIVVAERIHNVLEVPFALGQSSAVIGVSVGMARGRDTTSADGAEAPFDGDTAAARDSLPGYESLIRDADLALYQAKSKGKGRFVFFERSLQTAAKERLALETSMLAALDNDEFFLVYQPIVSLAEQQPVGVEALIRWRHPEHGVIPPERFMDVAEETGSIIPIGRWVLDEACRQAAAWSALVADPASFTLTVNVTGRELRDDEFVQHVESALSSAGLSPAQLVLELTESTVLDQPDVMFPCLVALKGLGVLFAIDGFGTGYSALNYLQRFPIDYMKIDKSYIDPIALGGSHAALTSAIVTLGSALGLRTVAEGVESTDQELVLRGMGCELGQGSLFGKPQVASQLDDAFDRAAAAVAQTSNRLPLHVQ